MLGAALKDRIHEAVQIARKLAAPLVLAPILKRLGQEAPDSWQVLARAIHCPIDQKRMARMAGLVSEYVEYGWIDRHDFARRPVTPFSIEIGGAATKSAAPCFLSRER